MIKHRYEYRINKKGAECYRTDDPKQLQIKLAELKEKKPNVVYTTQSRSCRLNKYGVMDQDHLRRPAWGIWH